jgi:hypothetical protein
MNKPEMLPSVEDVLDNMDRTLSADLVAAFAEIEGAAKDKLNPHFKSKYADIGSVIDAIKPVLARHNMAFYQRPQPSDNGVLVQTLLRHANGGEVDLGTLYVPANKQDAQGFGSALTYARRYALMTAFGVPAEDDDGTAAAATARPMAGEEQPANDPKPTAKEKDGDYSPTALRGAIKTLIRNINGCSTVRDLDELLELEEAKDTIEQCRRRFPAWWETGEGCPAEFTPLKKLIEQTRHGLKQLEQA